MSRKPAAVILTEQELELLRSYAGPDAPNRRIAERANMILLCAESKSLAEIAQQIGTRPARVSKWKQRFLRYRIFGLSDEQRPGAPASYDEAVSQRVLDVLDQPPPDGRENWNGQLIAERLGDVSQWQVWRILRRHGLQLQRRHSWVVPIAVELRPAVVDVAGLFVSGSHNALMLNAGPTGSPHGAEGFVRLTDKQVFASLNRMQPARESWNLASALDAASQFLRSRQPVRCRRRFLDFADEVASAKPELRTYAIIEGMTRPMPEWDRWLKANPQVQLSFVPNRDTWLDQIEFWFGLLNTNAEPGAVSHARRLREAVSKLMKDPGLAHAAPFEWHRGLGAAENRPLTLTTSAMELVS